MEYGINPFTGKVEPPPNAAYEIIPEGEAVPYLYLRCEIINQRGGFGNTTGWHSRIQGVSFPGAKAGGRIFAFARPRIYNRKTDEIPDGAVICDRSSQYGNPFASPNRLASIDRYKAWMLSHRPKWDSVIHLLRGKALVCNCRPKPCHCDVLWRIANNYWEPRYWETWMEFKWAQRHDHGYECSSRGDTRFSPLFAKLPDGRTIEEHYQCDVKGYEPGGTNWRKWKGKKPLRDVDLWLEYFALWAEWSRLNPALMDELRWRAGTSRVLTDRHASTDINQARALAALLNLC